jgi:hypothetical protein
MTLHVNDDGLEVRYGTSKATKLKGGDLKTFGDLQEIRMTITGTEVPSTDAPLDKKVTIPSGSYIESATLTVGATAFTSGGSATLDIGTMVDDGDGTYSTKDDDGIDAAIGKSTLAANARIACNGAQINTVVSSSDGLPLPISVGYGTAVFTAGVAELVVRYKVSHD